MTQYYFDHAASAPRREEVLEAMLPWLRGEVGNPSGAHRAARASRQAVEEARDEVGAFVGADPRGVIFTGGGTESCQMAIEGVISALAPTRERADVMISAVEHHAVSDAAYKVARMFPNVAVREIAVTSDGEIDEADFVAQLDEDVALISVMAANNETGVIHSLDGINAPAKGFVPGGVITHTDAIAAAPWLYLPGLTGSTDMISICAHKLGGPVNSGALIMRNYVPFSALTPGGGQEQGRRGGTVDVAAAVGLAAACRAVARELVEVNERVEELQRRMVSAFSLLPGGRVTALAVERLPGTVHVTFEGLVSDELLFLLDDAGVCVSAGASCSSGAAVGSHVLAAMGVEPERARGALRFSMGAETTAADVDAVISITAEIVHRLRSNNHA